ncbi:unnamed protein product [Spirodela intermedia]|uniref:Uncharacterized protein n=1 Tax=Spirodela intermedia TaxID=51605 RepID=A0A7I8LJ26_SPIIN|nr:unnamed protein product [Spirodela intermedia]
MAAGLHRGCFCLISAAIPAMCGAAMLVPETIANPSPALSNNNKKVKHDLQSQPPSDCWLAYRHSWPRRCRWGTRRPR